MCNIFSQSLITHAEPTKQVSYFSELYFNYYVFSKFRKNMDQIYLYKKLFKHDMQPHQTIDLRI